MQMAHLIIHVRTDQAMPPDVTCTAEIPGRLAAKGPRPAEYVVDAGHVDAALRVASRRDPGITLEGPVRAMAKRQTRAELAYELRHFVIDWEREQVTCHLGDMASRARRGRGAARELCTRTRRGVAPSSSTHRPSTRR